MRANGYLFALHVFALIVHLLLGIGLIALGYFDFLGVASTAESSSELFKKLAINGDVVFSQISVETINSAASLLTVLKTFATSAMVSFVMHMLAFWRCKLVVKK